MITLLFIIGCIVFALFIVKLALKLAWGLFKAAAFIVGLPVIVFALLAAGLVFVATPVLLIAIAAAIFASVAKPL